MTFQRTALFVSMLVLGVPGAAFAQLPEGARAMIEAARATGNDAKVATAIELARTAFPDDLEEIAALEAEWKSAKAERDAQAALRKEREIRSAGLFERWGGEGELGGFQSSGNSDTVGLTASLKLAREGIDWTHRLRGRIDYQRQNGVTSRERFSFAYEPRWTFAEDVFAYGLTQFERDRIQGFSGRYAVSGGLGYDVVDTENLSLSIKAGPAYRVTEFVDGRTESRLAGLAGFDFDWRLVDRVTLTQDANALAETGGEALLVIDGANTTLNLVSGLDFAVTDRLRARFSYQVDYDSNPPAGKVTTDTLTRATILYGF